MVVGENTATVNSAEVDLKSPVIEKDSEYYIPFSELDSVYNVDIEYVNNRVVIDSLDRKYQIATVAKDINVKSNPTNLSRTVDKVKTGDTVVISNREDDLVKSGWQKIRTSNGVLGYVKENTLGKINTIREDIVEKKNEEKNENSELKELNNELKKAIKEERYEDAAKLRDKIKNIENKK